MKKIPIVTTYNFMKENKFNRKKTRKQIISKFQGNRKFWVLIFFFHGHLNQKAGGISQAVATGRPHAWTPLPTRCGGGEFPTSRTWHTQRHAPCAGDAG